MDLTPRVPFDIDHDHTNVRFYWGVASGGTHAAMRRAHTDTWADHAKLTGPGIPPERLMVSYATKENGLWDGPKWMVDCGGSPDAMRANNGHASTISDYLDYIECPPTKYGTDPSDVEIEQVTLRDWPCEPGVRDILGLTVSELQERTLTDHIRMIDAVTRRRSDAQPVAVLQGWTAEDYLSCLDTYRDHGLVTDVVGLGSVCRRNSLDEIQSIAQRVRSALPPRVDLHGFGVKRNVLEHPSSLTVFDSVDSAAWDKAAHTAATRRNEQRPPPGMTYDDWFDYHDDGQARYTWRNIQLCYRIYRSNVEDLTPDTVDRDVQFVSIDDWPAVYDDLDGDASYPIIQCYCGTVIDPGSPDPIPDPGCRRCQRGDIDLFNHRLTQRETTLAD